MSVSKSEPLGIPAPRSATDKEAVRARRAGGEARQLSHQCQYQLFADISCSRQLTRPLRPPDSPRHWRKYLIDRSRSLLLQLTFMMFIPHKTLYTQPLVSRLSVWELTIQFVLTNHLQHWPTVWLINRYLQWQTFGFGMAISNAQPLKL